MSEAVAVGFTGTHLSSLTPPQRQALVELMESLKRLGFSVFHHGDAVHADTEATLIATRLGFLTVAHPASLVINTPSVKRLPILPHLKRNGHIVDASHVMIACPRLMHEELRSGTWMTIRYARRADKPLAIVWPDGSITQEK